MSDDDWIIVPNWDRFQHYSDRDPTWIKVYTALNSNAEFFDLLLSAKGLLLTIWIEYARSHGRLKVSRLASFVPSRGDSRHLLDTLESLNHAGFITVSASAPPAHLEKSREEKNARTREGKTEEQKHAAGVPAAAAYKPFETSTAPPRMDALPDLIADWLGGNGTVNLPPPEQEVTVRAETPEPETPAEPEPSDDSEDGDEEE